MRRLLKPRHAKENEHPAEEELFCYVDGELTAQATAKIRAHLEACWSCRVRTEKTQDDIASFIHLLNSALAPGLNPMPPPHGWRGFAAKVNRVMDETDHPSALAGCFASLRKAFLAPSLPFRLASAVLLGCLILFWVVARFNQVTPVSANQLLEQATEAQLREVRSVSQPVVYQKLRVRRIEAVPRQDDSLTWEIWNNPSGEGRVRQRVKDSQGQRFIDLPQGSAGAEAGSHSPGQLQSKKANVALERQPESSALPPLLQVLEQVFRANHMDWRAPLSPAAYAAWRRSVRGKDEEVVETKLPDGNRALALTTTAAGPLPVDAIVKAELVVRAQDWHPVQQSLRVQGENGPRDYELVETQFQVIALNSLPPSIFPDVNFPQAPLPLPQSPRAPTIATPTAEELMTAEMEAQFALHRLQACRLDPIEVAQDPTGAVEVRGLVRTSERKEELQAALHTVPLLRLKLQTMEEAARAAGSLQEGRLASEDPSEKEKQRFTTQEGGVERSTEVGVTAIPIQDRLKRYFSEPPRVAYPGQIQEKIHDLSNQAFTLSQAALSEAWALRRLAESYPAEKIAPLRPASRWLLETMVRDHLTALRTKITQSHLLLEPVLFSLIGESGGTASNGSATESANLSGLEDLPWTAIFRQLFHSVELADRLTLGLFLGVDLAPGQAEQAMRDLLASFPRLKGEFQSLEEQMARELSGNPDLLSQKQEKEP
ncbi:MAG: zf-HC2 domain-containing protein [Acidobacteria bacterium]|nr:zf-HC2 domain-containing protein [Acidobacteriota bacterium]